MTGLLLDTYAWLDNKKDNVEKRDKNLTDCKYKSPSNIYQIPDYEQRYFCKNKNIHLHYYTTYTDVYYDKINEVHVYIADNSGFTNNSLHNNIIATPIQYQYDSPSIRSFYQLSHKCITTKPISTKASKMLGNFTPK